MSDTYKGSKMWIQDILDATTHFKVTKDVRHGLDKDPSKWVRVVEAQADTGSRYVVVTAPIGDEGASICGGPIMVTVVSPWTDAHALQPTGNLNMNYVAEHLSDGRRDTINGGDLAAITLTVAYALDREAVL